MKALPILYGTFAAVLWANESSGFRRMGSLINHRDFSLATSSEIHRARAFGMSTKEVETVTANGSTKQTENDYDTSKALSALQKLVERQRSEILETERLIEQFSEELLSGTNRTKVADLIKNNTLGMKTSSILSAFDYGFRSRSQGCTTDLVGGGAEGDQFGSYGGPPGNFFSIGVQQFNRNLDAIRGEYKDEEPSEVTSEQRKLRRMLRRLTLNTTAIWEREKADDPVPSPLLVKIPYTVLCYFLDFVFEGRYVPSRFFFLETVARMPYFSYISMLHLYETLGFWRRSADVKRIHFAEEWNEFHHLLIMESLGGDQKWWVRFLAQHAAILYYFTLVILFAVSPTLSYKFSEMLETHAVHTYSQLLDENEEILKKLPPSVAAVEYYSIGAFDPLFDEYQTSMPVGTLRMPRDNIRSLYDVFAAIRDDEAEHVKTMEACLDPNVVVRSPSVEKNFLLAAALTAIVGYVASTGDFSGVSLVDEMDLGTMAAGEVDELMQQGSAPLFQDVAEGGLSASMFEPIRRYIVQLLQRL